MPGTINWVATFEGTSSRLVAELYDSSEGDTVRSIPVPCEPPIACPFPFEDVPFGVYTAALVSGGNCYYYDEGEAVVSAPDQHASLIVLSESTPSVSVEITVKI